MYIRLDKDSEDEQFVSYFFTSSVQGEMYYEQGKKRYEVLKKSGVIIFNKESGDLSFDQARTDEYFLSSSREKILILARMLKCKKSGEYPDILDIATGG